MIHGKITRRNVKTYYCLYLTSAGWADFKRNFKNKRQAYRYCESLTILKGTSIVEKLHDTL